MTTILSTAFGERTRPLGIDYHTWPIHHDHQLDDVRAQAEALDLLRRGDYTPVAEHISDVLRNADQLCYRWADSGEAALDMVPLIGGGEKRPEYIEFFHSTTCSHS